MKKFKSLVLAMKNKLEGLMIVLVCAGLVAIFSVTVHQLVRHTLEVIHEQKMRIVYTTLTGTEPPRTDAERGEDQLMIFAIRAQMVSELDVARYNAHIARREAGIELTPEQVRAIDIIQHRINMLDEATDFFQVFVVRIEVPAEEMLEPLPRGQNAEDIALRRHVMSAIFYFCQTIFPAMKTWVISLASVLNTRLS